MVSIFSKYLLSIRPYGIFLFLGIFSVFFFTFFIRIIPKKFYQCSIDDFIFFINFFSIVGFLGGRIFFYLVDSDDPCSLEGIINIFRGGFSIMGASGFAIAGAFFLRVVGEKRGLILYAAVTGLIIHAFGRVGCFFAHCCGGGFYFWFFGEYCYLPLQIIACMWYSIFFIIQLLYLWFEKGKGNEAYYLLFYSSVVAGERLILDPFRSDTIPGNDYFSKYQIIALGYLLFSFCLSLLLFWFLKNEQKLLSKK